MHELSDVIVGVSPAITALRTYLPKVARSSATVLITGATGTGKERIADAIHLLGPRALAPFIAVSCAAIPEALIESELFGHERGAFTGAVAASVGHVMRAHTGTLFLDEIGEMSPHGQAKLLRVLETRRVQPVGAARALDVNVRVIAATNQPLDLLVADGRFRADLYYRLNVARLELPPLKERPEDIAPLVAHAIRNLNTRDRSTVGLPDAQLLRCLAAYEWPGNVRELNNLVETIFIDPPEGQIGLRHLPPVFRDIFTQYRRSSETERDRLIGALGETNWNKAEAAKQLNWSRMKIYRKLAKYQIDRSR